MIFTANNWQDYELIDTGNLERLERWGKYVLRRPDPQCIWPQAENVELWEKPDMHYHRSETGGGYWENLNNVPESWVIAYKDLHFKVKPTAFKHTGIFPEQAVNWQWTMEKIQNAMSKTQKKIKILNLFAYTGGATVACAYAGASEVVHLDSSKGMTILAKENINLSNLQEKHVRFIIDDAVEFVKREIRRGNKYDAIIMDPPAYGRGPTGQMWEIEKSLFDLVSDCTQLLSDNPLFFLINAYANSLSVQGLENVLKLTVNKSFPGEISTGELGLQCSKRDLVVASGMFARWESNP